MLKCIITVTGRVCDLFVVDTSFSPDQPKVRPSAPFPAKVRVVDPTCDHTISHAVTVARSLRRPEKCGPCTLLASASVQPAGSRVVVLVALDCLMSLLWVYPRTAYLESLFSACLAPCHLPFPTATFICAKICACMTNPVAPSPPRHENSSSSFQEQSARNTLVVRELATN
jgi:hypothetical protein